MRSLVIATHDDEGSSLRSSYSSSRREVGRVSCGAWSHVGRLPGRGFAMAGSATAGFAASAGGSAEPVGASTRGAGRCGCVDRRAATSDARGETARVGTVARTSSPFHATATTARLRRRTPTATVAPIHLRRGVRRSWLLAGHAAQRCRLGHRAERRRLPLPRHRPGELAAQWPRAGDRTRHEVAIVGNRSVRAVREAPEARRASSPGAVVGRSTRRRGRLGQMRGDDGPRAVEWRTVVDR